MAMELRRFKVFSNLAPASWSAAVFSAALDPRGRHTPKSARKDRRTPKASPFRGITDARAMALELRRFKVFSNLAPASWSAAVFSAALDPRGRHTPKSARKDRRTPKASPFRGITD